MDGTLRLAIGALLAGVGATVMFGAPVGPIANLPNWPLVGMGLATLGLALVFSGVDRIVAENRIRNGNGEPEKLRVRLVKLAEQERMAEHRFWLAQEHFDSNPNYATRRLVDKRGTTLTRIRARIETTKALLNLAVVGPAK